MAETEPIKAQEFKDRLAAICLNPAGMGLPRKIRDRTIVLMSIVMTLESGREYSEPELNEAIKNWKARVGRELALDHVTLRRHLVDERYLDRDPAGTTYKIRTNLDRSLFGAEVFEISPEHAINEAVEKRQERKRRFTGRG